ncbi:hypothetical protein [Mucilaginibacter sp. dw_454]|uniref:hypothetical protein n=1 Tax=Mucilaginibacter sp. dw_454 TaxID=2720079 RepID=UPI001BD6BD8E|nr:hypothetical protein [Mucilaginibacter sp. dw_454]
MNNPKDALIAYEHCIDLVLANKEKVYDSDWSALLRSAMDVNKSYPWKYSNLLYGTRAEKMSDKIATLKQMGINYLFSFYARQGWTTTTLGGSPYGCLIGEGNTYILAWAINDDVFMQAFNACDTYKPVKMNDKKLYDLMKNHMENITKEKIGAMIMKYRDIIPVYHFEFYLKSEPVQQDPVDIWDFRTMQQNISTDEFKFVKQITVDKGNKIYQANIKTHFAQLFLRVRDDEKKYYDTINSGTERARVGKFD